MKINKEGIITECSIPFKIDLIPKSNITSRPQNKMTPKSITIHNTGNPDADAEDNSEFVDNTESYVSWTFTIGDNIILQELPIYENGWHAGDGTDGEGNRTSIGIEVSEKEGDKAYVTAIKFIAELFVYFNWDVEKNMFPHQYWSGKYCPRLILKKWISDFVPRIEEEMEKIREDEMTSRIDLKFVKDGEIIRDLEKSTIDKISHRLDLCNPFVQVVVEKLDELYSYCGYALKKGMRNDDNITLLQRALSKLGYYNMSFDNSFGEGCHSSVIKSQLNSGLQANGIVNEATANAINKLLKSQTVSEIPLDWKPYIKWGNKNLVTYTKFGQSRYIQYILDSLEYEIGIDGHYGNGSSKIIKIFQSDNGLEANGVVDEETYNYLTYKYAEWQESQDLLIDYYDNQTLVTRVRKEDARMDVMLCKQPVEYMKNVYNRLDEKPLLIMNAGLFGMKNGVTLSYLKDDGELITEGVYSKWVIGTDKSGNIDMFGMNWEKQNNNESDIIDCIGASPSLVVGGEKNIDKTGLDYGFLYYKHPRTGLGLNSEYIGGVCIQGRSSTEGYYGATIDQMADIFIDLEFDDGIGLDGGGSTYLMDEFGNKLDDDNDNRAIDSVVLLYRK